MMNICAICSNRQFANPDSLLQHARSSKKQHFFCDPCKLVFPGDDALKTHREAVHSSISCGICKLFFPNEEGLQVHYRASSTHTACKLCGAGFVDTNACTTHQRQHHGQVRRRRRRGCKSPSSSIDSGSSRSSSYSSHQPSSLRKSITPESVHTPVTVHMPLVDEPIEDDFWPERDEDDEEDDALPVSQQYVSPLRPTSPDEPAVANPSRSPTKTTFQPEMKRKNSRSPEHSPLEPQPQAVFSPSWRPGPSQVLANASSPIIVPPKPRLRPSLSKGSSEMEYSPLEPQLHSQLTNSSTPLLEAEMPLPPTEDGAVAVDDDDDFDDDEAYWENRPVIPPILAEDKCEDVPKGAQATGDECSETGHPSEYVNPFVDDDAEMGAVLTNINTSDTAAPPSDPLPDNDPIISPVVAPSRQFSMTLPIIREASDIPLPLDTESEDGHEPGSLSLAGDFASAFTDAPEFEHSPMPSLLSLPAVEDAFDGGDDFSDYAGSSACPSPLDTTYLSRLAREMCQTQSQDSMCYPDPFDECGSSGAVSPAVSLFDNHRKPLASPQAAMLDVHSEGEGHESPINQDDIFAETARVYHAFGHREDQDPGEQLNLDSGAVDGLDSSDHEHHNHEHIASDEVLGGHSSTWEDDAIGNDRTQARPSSSIERLTERFHSPQRSRSSRSRVSRREDSDRRFDREREAYQGNGDSTSGRTSRLSCSSSRSFNHSPDDETRMTTPVSPKEGSPLLEDMSLQNPRGPRFHCRLCMMEPCDEASATICGHIFCHSCITEEIMETSRCPVCNAPTLLYCIFKLDLHA